MSEFYLCQAPLSSPSQPHRDDVALDSMSVDLLTHLRCNVNLALYIAALAIDINLSSTYYEGLAQSSTTVSYKRKESYEVSAGSPFDDTL